MVNGCGLAMATDGPREILRAAEPPNFPRRRLGRRAHRESCRGVFRICSDAAPPSVA